MPDELPLWLPHQDYSEQHRRNCPKRNSQGHKHYHARRYTEDGLPEQPEDYASNRPDKASCSRHDTDERDAKKKVLGEVDYIIHASPPVVKMLR